MMLFLAGGFGFYGVYIDQNFAAANENSFTDSACSMPVNLCQKLLQQARRFYQEHRCCASI